jgi:hypothetical protein
MALSKRNVKTKFGFIWRQHPSAPSRYGHSTVNHVEEIEHVAGSGRGESDKAREPPSTEMSAEMSPELNAMNDLVKRTLKMLYN